jgi:hypothetical protein
MDNPQNDVYNKFKACTAFHYDNNFSFRFLWNLRNYVQHCGLPPGSWDFIDIQEGPEKGKTLLDISYDRNGLLEAFDWKKIKGELKNLPSQIDIIFHIRKLHSSIIEIAQLVAWINATLAREPYNYLSGLLNEVTSIYPNAAPTIAKFEEKSESDVSFVGIDQFPLRVMTLIRETLTKEERTCP